MPRSGIQSPHQVCGVREAIRSVPARESIRSVASETMSASPPESSELHYQLEKAQVEQQLQAQLEARYNEEVAAMRSRYNEEVARLETFKALVQAQVKEDQQKMKRRIFRFICTCKGGNSGDSGKK